MAVPRRHHHLSRESIAREALELVDEEGTDSLSLRRVAEMLGVGTMNLYTYVDDRDGLIRDIVALLLSEIELPADPDLTWEEFVIHSGHSLRAMALRHPRAFPFVALARYDEPAVLRYAQRVEDALVRLGFPSELLPKLASLLDAHGTGFLLIETQSVSIRRSEQHDPFSDAVPGASALLNSQADPAKAFDDDLAAIIVGFKTVHGICE